METIFKKLLIMQEKNLLTKQDYQIILAFVENVNIKKNELEALDRFITHLAMCFNRAYNNIQITELDSKIALELQKNVNYKKALSFLKNQLLGNTKYVITQAEQYFLLMHILNIFFS